MKHHCRAALPEGSLDATDRAIITGLRSGFPLSPRPFSEAAEALGLDEADLIARLRRLREIGAITRFGPLFSPQPGPSKAAGTCCLCALSAPAELIDEIIAIISEHTKIIKAHTCEHTPNLWFLLAADSPGGIDHAADRIRHAVGLDMQIFPQIPPVTSGFPEGIPQVQA